MFDPFDPAVDQPQTIDYDQLDPDALLPLGNQDVSFAADRESDLHDLHWARDGRDYARRVCVRLSTLWGDELMPMVTRFYPGYQETIYGTEAGMVVSKRLLAPLRSSYDRSALWLFELQAEGDHLLRMEIDIDWGTPVTQRIVDGLLVAQLNPREARGVYRQQNAETTRVFGNPQAPPDRVELPDAQRAHLTYHILVAGITDVSLLLTLSDVGEQVAWNGFLALRDAGQVFSKSNEHWRGFLERGRLWTPSPPLNRALQAGKLAAARGVRQVRTGLIPADRHTCRAPELVAALDAAEVDLSRRLLASLQWTAQRADGRLPTMLPTLRQEMPASPGPAIAETNGAYLAALTQHLRRQPDRELLADHYPAVALCAEGLVKAGRQELQAADTSTLGRAAEGLRWAAGLAGHVQDGANVARWESEAAEYGRRAGIGGETAADGLTGWNRALLSLPGWRMEEGRPAGFDDPFAGVALVGRAIWEGCGVRRVQDALEVQPAWPATWPWWALLDLPIGGRSISLLWDGEVLHSTLPVRFDGPVKVHDSIQAQGNDEYDFDLRFELVTKQGDDRPSSTFRPTFIVD